MDLLALFLNENGLDCAVEDENASKSSFVDVKQIHRFLLKEVQGSSEVEKNDSPNNNHAVSSQSAAKTMVHMIHRCIFQPHSNC